MLVLIVETQRTSGPEVTVTGRNCRASGPSSARGKKTSLWGCPKLSTRKC